jgi:hypothetical protein
MYAMSDLLLDIQYINRLSGRLEQFTKIRKDVWNARCPICGDSKKKLHLKRFYIYLKDGHYSVKCHNCGYSDSFFNFLKYELPDIYKEYLIDKFPKQASLNKNRFTHIKDIIPEVYYCKGFNYSILKRFSVLNIKHPARIYVQNRKIPDDKVFYCDNFSSFIGTLGIDHYTKAYKFAKEPRMIIPFYREDGLSTVFQARAFSKKESLRYITIKEHDQESKIYGLRDINKEKVVYYVEGPIDSLMIPNCLAMSGLSTKLPQDIKNTIFVPDNEPRNRDVIKAIRTKLIKGEQVVIYPDRLKYKDLNDMRVKGDMSTEKILDLINQNVYSGHIGLLKLNEWSKL